MSTELARRERCFICGGWGYVIVWRHYPAPCLTSTKTGWSLSNTCTYSNGPSMSGTSVRCAACWAADTAYYAWIRASRVAP